MSSASPTGSHETLPRVLGLPASYSLIVGSVIGSGIFIVPARVAEQVPSIIGIVLIWVAGGLFGLAGALTVAELGAMLPHAGGPYVYLREAYGRLAAFLFGWTEFLVIRAGAIATLASAFALNFAMLVPAPEVLGPVAWEALIAITAMGTLATINVLGTRLGGGLQVVGTVLKVGAMAAMILLPLPLLLGKASLGNLAPLWPPSIDGRLFLGVMGAMIGVLWTYDGWINVTALAEEIRDPGRNIPRAAGLGMLTLIALYLGVTLSYHLVLPMETVADPPGNRIVAAAFFERLIGPPGVSAIALIIMCSIFISLNANALTGPRAYFAMARDGLFPRALCRVHHRFQTPANAIIVQTVWASLLIVLGAVFLLIEPPGSESGVPVFVRNGWTKIHETPLYDVLFSYVIFGGTAIYSLTIAGVFVLRRTRPEWHRPYRTWGYPWTPLIYLSAAALLLGSMLVNTPFQSLIGIGIILMGVPGYLVFSRPPRSSTPKLPEP